MNTEHKSSQSDSTKINLHSKNTVIVHELQQRSVTSNTGNDATYNCDSPYNPAGTSGRQLKLTCNRITPTIVQSIFD